MTDDVKNKSANIVEKISRSIEELQHPEHTYLSQKIKTSFANHNLTDNEVKLLSNVVSALKKATPHISEVDKTFTDAELFSLIVDLAKGGEASSSVTEKHLGHLVSNVSASYKATKQLENLMGKDKDKTIG